MQNPYEQITLTEKAETKELVREVVNTSFNVVCATIGPNAGLVLINNRNRATVTKDGVSAARALDFGEHRRNMIAELITSAAIRVDDIVGDGTTTTVFMVKQLFDQYADRLTFATIRIIDDLVDKVKGYLVEQVIEVTPESDDFKRMIYTTTNYQKDIAENVIELFGKYLSPNVNLIAGGGHFKDEITIQENIVFEGEYTSPHLRPGTVKNALTLETCNVLLLDMQVNETSESFTQLLLNKVAEERTPIVIVARSFDVDTIATITNLNRVICNQLGIQPGTLSVIPYALNAPGTSGAAMFTDIGDIIDVPVYTTIPEESALKETLSIQVNDFKLDKEGIKFDATVPVIKQRVDTILERLVPVFDAMSITEKATVLGKISQRRISRLRAENVTIVVSGMTEGEISERYFLYEDAVKAAQSSLRYGVIPGIGYGFNKAAERLVEEVMLPINEQDILTVRDDCVRDIARSFVDILIAPYHHLTGGEYSFVAEDNYIYYPDTGDFIDYDEHTAQSMKNYYIDLVTGETEEVPTNVFDNGCAALCALESAWSVVKHIGRLEAILGKSNSSYIKK